ncbi:VCBS repeat-containing protein [Streptomyces sp. NBC_00335]|uniref:FG-GAP repeat domain-containing protein n=1 Tax=unclassified Streptomyces TaxID=2593676 RepID=UPI00224CE7A0|nr:MULTISPECIES: VCBS repeat-containing protein [unclassified Streptomyces]MCX5407049.1 VCBS repeat-containing protein [Streptomyces sp. NBC_00086]
MRRLLSIGSAVALLVTGGVLGAGAAVAAGDPTFFFDPVVDKVLMPGEERIELSPSGWGGQNGGQPDGTYIYALSKKPLTDAGWTGGGVPTGLSVDPTDECAPKAGIAGVYLCDVKEWGHPTPRIATAATAPDGATAYYGLVYVPRGASISAGIKEAQTAGSKDIGPRRAHATVTVKSNAHVAQNTMALSTPTLPAGGFVKHTVKLHAVDKGRLRLYPSPAPGFRRWDDGELKVAAGFDAGGAAGAGCSQEWGLFDGLACDIKKPGDYTLTYTLTAEATAPAWKVRTTAVYDVYTSGTGNPEETSDFAVASSTPVTQRFRLVGRDAEGGLWDYRGTGKAAEPFTPVDPVGGSFDWSQYTALTRLEPVTVQSTGRGAVGRDKAGVLWFHPTSGDGSIYKDRIRVGGGWNIFNALVGVSDVTGDKKADLLARDAEGGLWLYPGTGLDAKPFGSRVKVGTSWNIYDQLVGGTDLTGDGKADVVARDKAGNLWFYQGTGVAAKPLSARKQIGTGWQIYDSIVAPGDLTSDGKADMVARDKSGNLWLYQGTGVAAKPFGSRVKVSVLGTGFGRYNLLF